MLLQVFEVQELERDAGPPQFGVDPRGIRQRTRGVAGDLRPIQPLLQRVVRQPFEPLQREPDGGRPAQDRRYGPGTDPQAAGRLPVAPFQAPFQSQNLSNVSHRQSVRRHRPLRRTGVRPNGRW